MFTKTLARFLRFLAKAIAPASAQLEMGPNDIVPGTQKPSLILIDMISAQVIKFPELLTSGPVPFTPREIELMNDPRYRGTDMVRQKSFYKWSDGRIKINIEYYDRGYDPYGAGRLAIISVAQVFVNSILADLSKEEKDKLYSVLWKAGDLQIKQKKINDEADRQRKAVEAIENFFTVALKEEN